MNTKETENNIDLNELKQEVHTGLLEALVLLRQGRDKINALSEDEEINRYSSDVVNQLGEISADLAGFSCQLSDMIALFFLERLELKFDALKKQRTFRH